MEPTRQEIIQEILEGLLHKMDFQAEVKVWTEGEENPVFLCSARVEGGQNFLIGQHGANLTAIQHLTRALVYKKIGERLNVLVDVNNYLLDKKALLEEEAGKAAQEVIRDQALVAMRPMLSYERKIVHTFLSANPDVITESVGEGDERKVIVRPKSKPAD